MTALNRLAVGLMETKGIAPGIKALDAAVKAASVQVLRAGIVCPSKYVVLLTGTPSCVREAVSVGKVSAGPFLYDDLFLPRLGFDILEAMSGERGGREESVGIVETLTIASGLRALDAAMKAASVRLCEVQLGFSLGGRTFFSVTGKLADVIESLQASRSAASDDGLLGDTYLMGNPADTGF